MSQGIEKIVFDDATDLTPENFVILLGSTVPDTNWIIRADKRIRLKALYYLGTPLEDQENARWIAGPKKAGGYTSEDRFDKIGDAGYVSIEPKFCGPQEFTIEAYIDEPTNAYPKQLTFRGYAPEKIKKTFWSRTKAGEDLKPNPIDYGDDVWLNMQVEGLNGAELVLEVYDKTWAWGDSVAGTYYTQCIEGEVNFVIRDTFNWKDTFQIGQDEFYAMVKVRGSSEYLKDDYDDDVHARFLRVDNEVSNRETRTSYTDRPAVVEQNQVNFQRYELCGFAKIEVNDQTETIVLFDQDILQSDENDAEKEFMASESVHFDTGSHELRQEDKDVVLKGIVRLLLNNPNIPVKLGAHTDYRGASDYNQALSQRRANSAVAYLLDQGIEENRIEARGYGERQPLIDFPENDSHTSEQLQPNRRVTIEFLIFGENAESIVFNTIAGDQDYPVDLTFNVIDYNVDQCVSRGLSAGTTHKTDVDINVLTTNSEVADHETKNAASPFTSSVSADLLRMGNTPLSYIWPINAAFNQYQYHIHSCRYYALPKIPAIITNVYSDIKWKLEFYLNLSNDLSVRWQNVANPEERRELQQRAGHMGAERRWQQKDATFGFEMDANWNKNGEDSYARNQSFKVEFETKIRKLYDLFHSIGDISRAITQETKGTAREIGLGGVPIVFAVTPPNINLKGEWYLKRAQQDGKAIKKIGTQVEISFNASPLVGLEITIDLIGAAIGLGGAAISGGTQATNAVKLWQQLDGALNRGVGVGNEEAGADISADVYIDLVLSGEISSELGFSFNTVGDPNPGVKLELVSKIGVELKGGILVEGEIRAWVVKANAYFKAAASGKASITFGHGLEYDNEGLFYVPQLGFDGLDAEYEVSGAAGLSVEKDIVGPSPEIDFDDSWTLARGEFNELVPKFDVIKKLAELTGFEPKVPLIRKN
ncbi:hypothetical protein GCM10022393_02000 [Aquimarina addita]|uniref:OmpA-like domain-containing protein n=1 Tax=Aquimarina addita TaxID=870485 RepID=A0ABP7X9G0_9FLAO